MVVRDVAMGDLWLPELWQGAVVVCQRCGKNLQGHSIVGFDSLKASVQEMAITLKITFFKNILKYYYAFFDW